MSEEREVIFEFTRLGAALRVSAIDAATGIEAILIADPMAEEGALTRLARQKLDYVLARRRPVG